MELELTAEQRTARTRARTFVERHVAPLAGEFDRRERLPDELIAALAHEGYLGSGLPADGTLPDPVSVGLIAEEFGRGCSSARSLLTVQTLVGRTLAKWGGAGLRERWLSKLATGETIAAFALTEPEAGSDAASLQTVAERCGEGYALTGTKSWVSFGQIAEVFLTFARCEGQHMAFLVEPSAPGLVVEPVSGLLGLRASLLATVRFEGCVVPSAALVGRPGTGWSHVAAYALDEGRFGVAWGCVGIGRAALEASVRYAGERRQFGMLLRDQQLIRRLITDMLVNVEAARLLCFRAARSRAQRSHRALSETAMAKYFAANAAYRAAADAVQIHGARGVGDGAPVQRLWRDATIMQIIEGSSQMHQLTLAEDAYREYGAAAASGRRAAEDGP